MELKSTEFRIGNLIQDSNKNLLEISGLHNDTIYSVYPVGVTPKFETTVNPNEIEHIPLTEEWLLKFGFSKDLDSTTYVLELDKFSKLVIEDDFSFSLHDNDDNDMICFKNDVLNSVHRLQNLYFALTSKELEIK